MKIAVSDFFVPFLQPPLSESGDEVVVLPSAANPMPFAANNLDGVTVAAFVPAFVRPDCLELVMSSKDIVWVQSLSAGVEVLAPWKGSGNPSRVLTNARNVFSAPMAEFALALMLSVAKRLPMFSSWQQRHHWQPPGSFMTPLSEIGSQTVCILGVSGSIGQALATRCEALGMKVHGVRRQASARDVPHCAKLHATLIDAVKEADYVVVCVPLTDATHHIVNGPVLDAMKPSAWLINVSRGACCDEAALIAALQTQLRGGGAALDVVETEPLREDSPLWNLPNVYITPHISYSSPHTQDRLVEVFLRNLVRFKAGEELENVVDVI